MIFPAVAIFALVTSFITPILSAPIPVPNSNVELTKSHLSHRVFAKGPSASLGPYHHGMYNILNHDGSMEPIADIHSRPVHIDTVGGAAEPALSRVGEGESPRLVRRKSLGAKIKAAFKKVGAKIKSAFQKVGAKIKSGFQKAGAKIKSAFQKVGAKIKSGFQKAGAAIKKVAKKIGNGIKTAAKKVGHFLKTTGAKIAKFGLKVVATVAKVVGRVASFIPAIGKPISKALSGVSTVANFASDKIHANLGKKLTKGMNIMNKIQNPVGGAAGKVLDAVLKRDMDGEHVFERDLPELEIRSLEGGEDLEARSFEGEYIDTPSFGNASELEIRSFEDFEELETRSWDFEGDEA